MAEFMGKDPNMELTVDKTDEELLSMAEKAYESKKVEIEEIKAEIKETNAMAESGETESDNASEEEKDEPEIYDPLEPLPETDILDVAENELTAKKQRFTGSGDRIILGIAAGLILGAVIGIISVNPAPFVAGGIVLGLAAGVFLDIKVKNK